MTCQDWIPAGMSTILQQETIAGVVVKRLACGAGDLQIQDPVGVFIWNSQSQCRAHSDSSQPSWPDFQISVESFDPSSTLLDWSLILAEARVRRVGTRVETLDVLYLEL